MCTLPVVDFVDVGSVSCTRKEGDELFPADAALISTVNPRRQLPQQTLVASKRLHVTHIRRSSLKPFKGQKCQLVTIGHPGLAYIFLISDIRRLDADPQADRLELRAWYLTITENLHGN